MTMHSLKQLLFPTYRPDNALTLPDNVGGQSPRQSYDYSDLVAPTTNGQLHKYDHQGRTTSWNVVTANSDNGKKSPRLTDYDNALLIRRKLDPAKAAFLKPIWAKGHDRSTGTKVAHRNLRNAGQQTRGYGENTIKKYWAAFNRAYESETAPASPTAVGGGVRSLKGKIG